MLSKERSENFLTNVLGLTNPDKLFKEDKLELLSQIVSAYQAIIPFQSLSLMSKGLTERRTPTVQESIVQVEAGKGGLCYSVNVYLKLLLEGLGFSVHYVYSSVKFSGSNNHIIPIVCDVRVPGDRYLVDAGTGYLTPPIPMDFDKESPVYDVTFVKYKYVYENGLLVRYHLRGRHDNADSTWEMFYDVDLTPRDIEMFDASMAAVYTDPTKSPFHVSMRAIKFPNGKAVCICDMKLLVEDDAHTLQETKFSSEAEFLEGVRTHFPLLEESAKKALGNWTSGIETPFV